MPKRVHDMGGEPAGPIDLAEHNPEPWQKLLFAMREVLGDAKRDLVSLDEVRRAIEDLGDPDYHELAYFDRVAVALATILIEKGVVTDKELQAQAAEIRSRRENALER